MDSLYDRAMDQIGMPPVFDPVFQGIYVAQGMEATLIHLANRHDPDEIEVKVVRATIMGLISVEQA